MGTFLHFVENMNWGKRLGIVVWHYLIELKLHMPCDLATPHLTTLVMKHIQNGNILYVILE